MVDVGAAGRGPDAAFRGATDDGVDALAELMADGGVVMLTGAGMSTDSGIPDYRGPGAVDRRPMTYADFVSDAANRRRYWARSHVGWRRMVRALPNSGHEVLARLEAAGVVDAVVTQNVDRLHTAAGSRLVVDLHGRIDEIVCLGCGSVTSRAALDDRLAALNPGWADRHDGEDIAPDGDAAVAETDSFVVAGCVGCGGVLKPHLVFFGESVPRPRVERAYALVDRARALVVAGSSLTVFSGRRFVKHARSRGIPVAVVNRGPTRGDDLADVRIEGGCAQTLLAVEGALAVGAPRASRSA